MPGTSQTGQLLLTLTCVASLIGKVASQNYNPSATDCGDGSQGYLSISDLQQDINTERDRVLAGGSPPNGPYKFTLCPRRPFRITEPLVPALDNIEIGCGDPPLRSNNCFVSGSDIQVDIQEFRGSSFPVTQVTLQGLGFGFFGDAAIAGDATDATELVLQDVAFQVRTSERLRLVHDVRMHSHVSLQAFDGASNLVRQQPAEGSNRPPFRVSVFEAAVTGGSTTGDAFLNEGGELVIQGLQVSGVTVPTSLIQASGNSASVFIDQASANSAAMSVTQSEIGVSAFSFRLPKCHACR